MNIFIVSGDPVAMKEVYSKLKRSDYEVEGMNLSIEDSILQIQQSNPDVIITDIDLENSRLGSDLKKIANESEIPFLFVSEDADDSLYHRVKKSYPNSHFLVKPIEKYALWSSVDNLIGTRANVSGSNYIRNGYLFLKKNGEFKKLKLEDVTYMYSEGNYSTIVLGDKKYLIKFSLSKLLSIDQFDCFVRIHRNYAILKHSILTVDFAAKQLTTKDMTLPFGRTYVKDIRRVMNIPFSKV